VYISVCFINKLGGFLGANNLGCVRDDVESPPVNEIALKILNNLTGEKVRIY